MANFLDELLAAAIFLIRLPFPVKPKAADDLPARAMGWYALIGAAIGLAGGLAFWIFHQFDLTRAITALLAMTVVMVLTGALHERGLVETMAGVTADGERADRLAAMRTSALGLPGALALFVLLGLRWSALGALAQPGPVIAALVAAHALSRAMLPAMALVMEPARADGLAAAHGKPAPEYALLALGSGAALAILCEGWTGIVLTVVAVAFCAAMGWLAKVRFNGYTGSVLGATQQVVETAVLLAVLTAT